MELAGDATRAGQRASQPASESASRLTGAEMICCLLCLICLFVDLCMCVTSIMFVYDDYVLIAGVGILRGWLGGSVHSPNWLV